jgi:hypothetical protein
MKNAPAKSGGEIKLCFKLLNVEWRQASVVFEVIIAFDNRTFFFVRSKHHYHEAFGVAHYVSVIGTAIDLWLIVRGETTHLIVEFRHFSDCGIDCTDL